MIVMELLEVLKYSASGLALGFSVVLVLGWAASRALRDVQ